MERDEVLGLFVKAVELGRMVSEMGDDKVAMRACDLLDLCSLTTVLGTAVFTEEELAEVGARAAQIAAVRESDRARAAGCIH